MRKNRLFWRMFIAFFTTLFVTVIVLSMLMVVFVREERRSALDNELLVHARDFALLLQQRNQRELWLFDNTLRSALEWKLNDLPAAYEAQVWVVSNTWYVLALGGQSQHREPFNDPEVIGQLIKVLNGEDVRSQGMFRELGANMVSIGVPWYTPDGEIVGAVFVHVSIASLAVDYSDMIRYALIAALCAMAIGTPLCYIISRRHTKPISEIQSAVVDFASGNLERRVQVKGADELAQLAQSFNQMAEDLSNLEESRRSFVANVSHELRSPLTCVQGYIEGIQDGVIPPEDQSRYLDVTLSETKRLTKLVGDLLDLSRFESGKFPLQIGVFDVNELIVLEMLKFERRIEEKKIGVELNFRDTQCFVRADRDRISQVVTNLIDNAVKFLPEDGQGELMVSTHTVDRVCYVTVKDNGSGIAQQDLPFIFERFYKADKAHTSGMGTGLGLSIVKRILDQHGQTIRLSSGQTGTSAAFTLEKAGETPTNP